MTSKQNFHNLPQTHRESGSTRLVKATRVTKQNKTVTRTYVDFHVINRRNFIGFVLLVNNALTSQAY